MNPYRVCGKKTVCGAATAAAAALWLLLHAANLQSCLFIVKAYLPAVFGTTSARSCKTQHVSVSKRQTAEAGEIVKL